MYCTTPTPPVLTHGSETGRYDLAWKDLCSVLNALSKIVIIIKGIVISFLCSWIFVTHRKTPALARFSCIAEM